MADPTTRPHVAGGRAGTRGRGTAVVLGDVSPVVREISGTLASAGFSVAHVRPSTSGAQPAGPHEASVDDECAFVASIGDDPDAVELLVERIETSWGPVSLLVVVADRGRRRDVTSTSPHHLRAAMSRHFFVAAWLAMTLADTMRDAEDALVVHVGSAPAADITRQGSAASAAGDAALTRFLEVLGSELRSERATPRVVSLTHPPDVPGSDTARLVLALLGEVPVAR